MGRFGNHASGRPPNLCCLHGSCILHRRLCAHRLPLAVVWTPVRGYLRLYVDGYVQPLCRIEAGKR